MLTVRQIAEAVPCSKMTVSRFLKAYNVPPTEQRGNTPYYPESVIDLVRGSMSRYETANSADIAPDTPQDADSNTSMIRSNAELVAKCAALEQENAVLKAQNAELQNRIQDLQRNAEAMQSNMESLQRLADSLTATLSNMARPAIPEKTHEPEPEETPRHWWQVWKR